MRHDREDYDRAIQAPEEMIPAAEPVFLLRGQDAAAAATVRFWAFKVLQLGGDPETVRRAVAQAEAMDLWPVKKAPDAPR